MLVPGVWLHPRPSWGRRDSLSTKSRSEPNGTCWSAVCVIADWSLSSLPPSPTATSQKEKENEKSARMHSIGGNDNSFISLASECLPDGRSTGGCVYMHVCQLTQSRQTYVCFLQMTLDEHPRRHHLADGPLASLYAPFPS